MRGSVRVGRANLPRKARGYTSNGPAVLKCWCNTELQAEEVNAFLRPYKLLEGVNKLRFRTPLLGEVSANISG
jgi:hypothetical protein